MLSSWAVTEMLGRRGEYPSGAAPGAGAFSGLVPPGARPAGALFFPVRDQEIDTRETDPEAKAKHAFLRTVFPSLLVTGPFSIVLGFTGGLMALNDRLKLRSMVVGEKGSRVYIASEEAAIRTMEPDVDTVWAPTGGEPVIVRVKEGAY